MKKIRFIILQTLFLLMIAGALNGCADISSRSPHDFQADLENGDLSSTAAIFRSQSGTRWHGIYLDDVKVGWGKTVRTMPTSWLSSGNSYQIRKEHRIRLLANGYPHRITYRQDLQFASQPPYALEQLISFEEINDYTKRFEMTKTRQGYRQTLVQGGIRKEREINAFDYTLEDEMALETWVLKKPPVGDFIQINRIDPNNFQKEGGFAKVVSIENRNVAGRSMPLYRIEHPVKNLGAVESTYRQDLILEAQKMTSGFDLRRETEAAARAPLPEVDLHVNLMLPIDVPIGNSKAVRRVTLAVDSGTGALLTQATGQRIEKMPDGDGYRLTLDAADGYRQSVTSEERSQYGKVPSTLQENGDNILKDAREAMDGIADAKAKIDRLLAFVDDTVEDSNQVLAPDLQYLLAKRKGDCSEHAALFEALARAFGIPCRKVSGLVYMGDWAQCFGLHAWNEVALDGYWKPVDPIKHAADLPPLYIRFPIDQEVNSRLSRSVPQMQINVLEVDLSIPDISRP